MKRTPAVTLALVASLAACGGSAVPERDVRGVGAVCDDDVECAAGMRCTLAEGRGICQPPPREGAVSLPPDAPRTFANVGEACQNSSDCAGGLDCVASDEGLRCEPAPLEK